VATPTIPAFFERDVRDIDVDSTAEDCSTGITFAAAEFAQPSQVFVADLTQSTFTSGAPAGTWSGPAQIQI
jgi:hypothetical protein